MPKPKPSPPPNADDPEQSRRFIDMAREVEAEDDPEAFDRAFTKVLQNDRQPKLGCPTPKRTKMPR